MVSGQRLPEFLIDQEENRGFARIVTDYKELIE
jgi:hypothetical protein